MNLLRPRNLALLFAAYFGVIGYYAVQAARRASSGGYSAEISTTIYQTTMVGGVLVLVGIFITASISPHIKGGPPSRSTANPRTGLVTRRLRRDSAQTSTDYRGNRPAESAWPAAADFPTNPPDSDRPGSRARKQA